MTFCILTHVPHGQEKNQYFAYAPYVREMNIWLKYVDEVYIVAPLELNERTAIHIQYENENIQFRIIPKMDLLSLKSILMSIVNTPKISWQIFEAMKNADHIHLRCPGNIGLMAAIVQILFPRKPKTAKYAGNWDPKSNQPFSYRLQKWILSNTFLTKNMQVLVYGEWDGSSKNIKSFFTASYWEKDKIPVVTRNLENRILFVFVGTLSSGKQPLYTIQLVRELYDKGYDVSLSLYGNGKERENLQKYIFQNNLETIIHLKGNLSQDSIKKVYQESHFIMLPSQSEGWPKVVAEAMFWGCLPITTNVSCIGNMLDNGNRGLLLKMNIDDDVRQIIAILEDQEAYNSKVQKSILWSRKYTLDLFETEIKMLLNR